VRIVLHDRITVNR